MPSRRRKAALRASELISLAGGRPQDSEKGETRFDFLYVPAAEYIYLVNVPNISYLYWFYYEYHRDRLMENQVETSQKRARARTCARAAIQKNVKLGFLAIFLQPIATQEPKSRLCPPGPRHSGRKTKRARNELVRFGRSAVRPLSRGRRTAPGRPLLCFLGM